MAEETQIHAPKSLQSQSTVNLHKINKQWTPQHQEKSKSYLLKQILVLKIQKNMSVKPCFGHLLMVKQKIQDYKQWSVTSN